MNLSFLKHASNGMKVAISNNLLHIRLKPIFFTFLPNSTIHNPKSIICPKNFSRPNFSSKNFGGFTIVELLVVIVVIGIIAAITIVSYTGISQKADIASLQSDLNGAKKQLDLYYVDHGYYPADLDANNCPLDSSIPPIVDTRYCLKTSPNNSFGTSSYTPTGDPPQSYTLVANNGTIVYQITNDTGPEAVTTASFTAIADISGTTTIGSVLTAGALTPSNATVTYQWQSATTAGGSYTDITGETSNTYTLQTSDWTKYIKVVAIATGSYTGTQTSTASSAVTDPDWIAGVGSGAMSGKYVRSTDAGSFSWGRRNEGCPDGGRAPTKTELLDIYANRGSYGSFQTDYYWSSDVYAIFSAYMVYFGNGNTYNDQQIYDHNVRCVLD